MPLPLEDTLWTGHPRWQHQEEIEHAVPRRAFKLGFPGVVCQHSPVQTRLVRLDPSAGSDVAQPELKPSLQTQEFVDSLVNSKSLRAQSTMSADDVTYVHRQFESMAQIKLIYGANNVNLWHKQYKSMAQTMKIYVINNENLWHKQCKSMAPTM